MAIARALFVVIFGGQASSASGSGGGTGGGGPSLDFSVATNSQYAAIA